MPTTPVSVIVGFVAFKQTLVVPVIVAVGKGFTVIVAVPDCNWEQELESDTLIKL